jgi:hypothetical protein
VTVPAAGAATGCGSGFAATIAPGAGREAGFLAAAFFRGADFFFAGAAVLEDFRALTCFFAGAFFAVFLRAAMLRF